MAVSNIVKKTTGLTGYNVVPNAREVLCGLYLRTLTLLQGYPKEAWYRKQTEQVVQQRLQVVQSETEPELIEQKIACGQMEELIDQAERELSLTTKMEDYRPWEPLASEPPPNQWKWP